MTWGGCRLTGDEPRQWIKFVTNEAVAAVAAIDEDIAEEAAELIKVEYEELPGVYDPEEAMQEGAPSFMTMSRIILVLITTGNLVMWKGFRRILYRS